MIRYKAEVTREFYWKDRPRREGETVEGPEDEIMRLINAGVAVFMGVVPVETATKRPPEDRAVRGRR